ncbi:hypothetical protein AXG93_684s1130 [Marchantia polymorpha subsp. ruderalis]|uniref:Integrase catalytic domain-containing protein n=1 Tax=Marchantia polymorpha subsp. ruderalis TaxID=1480154 RepID=A0A176W763_MARPO|nr:hypothetical protein AXG93_684s1130 [Marchantia polymorpha subsp. ruderalis]
MFDGVVCTLTNVRYISEMKKNLIFLGVLDTNGHRWSVAYDVLQVKARDKAVLKGNTHRNLYELEGNTVCGEVNVTRSRPEMAQIWYLTLLRKKYMLSDLGKIDLDFCEHCFVEKHHRKLFGVGIHSSKVRYLRSENGGEYTSKEFGEYFKVEGITRHLTSIYTLQKFAVCEQLNQIVLEKVRSMMSQSGLPYKFWFEAVNTAVYLVNRSPSSATDFSTSFELRHKRVADYIRLRIFGCTAYPLIPKEHRTKLDPISKKCRLLGYASGVKDYTL